MKKLLTIALATVAFATSAYAGRNIDTQVVRKIGDWEINRADSQKKCGASKYDENTPSLIGLTIWQDRSMTLWLSSKRWSFSVPDAIVRLRTEGGFDWQGKVEITGSDSLRLYITPEFLKTLMVDNTLFVGIVNGDNTIFELSNSYDAIEAMLTCVKLYD